MSDKELLGLAREAGADVTCGSMGMTLHAMFNRGQLVRFAALVVAAEREACALVCDEMQEHWSAIKDTALLNGDVDLSNASSGEPRAAESLAALIRARGKP